MASNKGPKPKKKRFWVKGNGGEPPGWPDSVAETEENLFVYRVGSGFDPRQISPRSPFLRLAERLHPQKSREEAATMSLGEAAGELGVSKSEAERILEGNRIAKENNRFRKRDVLRLARNRMEEANRAPKNGHFSGPELAAITGLPYTKTKMLIKKHGLERCKEGYLKSDAYRFFGELEEDPKYGRLKIVDRLRAYWETIKRTFSAAGLEYEEGDASFDRETLATLVIRQNPGNYKGILKGVGYTDERIDTAENLEEVCSESLPDSKSVSKVVVLMALGADKNRDISGCLYTFGLTLNEDGVDRKSLETTLSKLPVRRSVIEQVFRKLNYTDDMIGELADRSEYRDGKNRLEYHFARKYSKDDIPRIGKGLDKKAVSAIHVKMDEESKEKAPGFFVAEVLLDQGMEEQLENIGYVFSGANSVRNRIRKERAAYNGIIRWAKTLYLAA